MEGQGRLFRPWPFRFPGNLAVFTFGEQTTAESPYLFSFWHFWFATVQEVLQADWQDAWHSPQPVCAEALMQGCWMVLMCFIAISSILLK